MFLILCLGSFASVAEPQKTKNKFLTPNRTAVFVAKHSLVGPRKLTENWSMLDSKFLLRTCNSLVLSCLLFILKWVKALRVFSAFYTQLKPKYKLERGERRVSWALQCGSCISVASQQTK